MFYKLSNIAVIKEIETEFDVNFEYPNLYEQLPVINGLKESTVSIITMEDPSTVKYAIWGLLPETFEDNWDVFQDSTNTLNINIDNFDQYNDLYSEAIQKRRCLIIVSGFFTSVLHKGSLHPFNIHLKHNKPFCIAGVYNKLEDGFITCSIFITKSGYSLNTIPNLSPYLPLVFNKEEMQYWLNKDFEFEDLSNLINDRKNLPFKSHSLWNVTHKDNILFKKMIETNEFKNVSTHQQ